MQAWAAHNRVELRFIPSSSLSSSSRTPTSRASSRFRSATNACRSTGFASLSHCAASSTTGATTTTITGHPAHLATCRRPGSPRGGASSRAPPCNPTHQLDRSATELGGSAARQASIHAACRRGNRRWHTGHGSTSSVSPFASCPWRTIPSCLVHHMQRQLLGPAQRRLQNLAQLFIGMVRAGLHMAGIEKILDAARSGDVQGVVRDACRKTSWPCRYRRCQPPPAY